MSKMRKHILYNGEVELIFDPWRHAYTVDGERVDNATGILDIIAKPALIGWAAKVASEYWRDRVRADQSYSEALLQNLFKEAKKEHTKKKTSAGDIGTFVHNWVEDYINGSDPLFPSDPKLLKLVNRFLGWAKENKVEFLLAEQVVYSRKYNYAGMLDFICRINGKLYIGDLKTSKGIYKSHKLQTAGYRNARVEEFPEEKYAGQVIVQIGKDGSFSTWMSEDDKIGYKMPLLAFLSAQKLKQMLFLMDEESVL